MADMKFGLGQVRKPTPSKVNMLVKVYMGVAGAFLGWMQTNNFIRPHTQNVVSSLIGLSLLVVPLIAPLFGVDIDDVKSVPAGKVTAMDTDEKPKT